MKYAIRKWGHSIKSFSSRVIGLNNILAVLIHNFKTAWPTKISLPFLTTLRQFAFWDSTQNILSLSYGCSATLIRYWNQNVQYYRWGDIDVYQQRQGLVFWFAWMNHCTVNGFLLLYEMSWECQKQGPWTNHDVPTHRRVKNNRNCHVACAHHGTLTSPVTPSISLIFFIFHRTRTTHRFCHLLFLFFPHTHDKKFSKKKKKKISYSTPTLHNNHQQIEHIVPIQKKKKKSACKKGYVKDEVEQAHHFIWPTSLIFIKTSWLFMMGSYSQNSSENL